MTFRIEFSNLAAHKFRKMEQQVRRRIAARLSMVAGDPAHYLIKLRSIDAYKLRAGDYRVILDVDWEEQVLYVLTLGHRSTVYR